MPMEQTGNQKGKYHPGDCYCMQPQRGWIIKYPLKVNFTLWERNSRREIPLLGLQKGNLRRSEVDDSSFIGEHSITETQEWEIGASSSQAIMLYNSKSDGYYQTFKDH